MSVIRFSIFIWPSGVLSLFSLERASCVGGFCDGCEAAEFFMQLPAENDNREGGRLVSLCRAGGKLAGLGFVASALLFAPLHGFGGAVFLRRSGRGGTATLGLLLTGTGMSAMVLITTYCVTVIR